LTALIQHVVSFVPVNESEIIYGLKEEDFHFLVETDSYDTIAQNETIDLDSLLPKIVSHARIENFFSVPTNFFNKKMDLYKITRLPLFVDETKALYTASLPRYLALGDDGSSSESSNDVKRRCTVDEKSRYTFCTILLESTLTYTFFLPIVFFVSFSCFGPSIFNPYVVHVYDCRMSLSFFLCGSLPLSLSLTSISRMSLPNVAISLRFLVWTWMSFLV